MQLGDLGRFVLGIKATSINTPEEVDAGTIKRVYVRFVPSVYFLRKIKELKVKIQKLDFKGLVIKEDTPQEHGS